MGFATFVGRLLFTSVFILAAYQEFTEFGTDGGPAVKIWRPKYNIFEKFVSSQTGTQLPPIDIKMLVAFMISLKGLGSLLFIFGSSLGAILLLLHQLIATPMLYDFYNYEADKKEFNQLFIKFTQNLALFGALLYFIGMKNSIPKRLRKRSPKSKTN
ncbi:hypothetical protein ACFE04_007346 [Oxalis oulophora]